MTVPSSRRWMPRPAAIGAVSLGGAGVSVASARGRDAPVGDGAAGVVPGGVRAGAPELGVGEWLARFRARSCSSALMSGDPAGVPDDDGDSCCLRSAYGCRSAGRRLSAMLSAKRLLVSRHADRRSSGRHLERALSRSVWSHGRPGTFIERLLLTRQAPAVRAVACKRAQRSGGTKRWRRARTRLRSRQRGCGWPVNRMMARITTATATISHICTCRGRTPRGCARRS
jgi:hypothetical protein